MYDSDVKSVDLFKFDKKNRYHSQNSIYIPETSDFL